jgi:hypothetical protein
VSSIGAASRPEKATGITVRDYFAARAICLFPLGDAEVRMLAEGVKPQHEVVAAFCYGLADAMLAERNKP